MCCKVSGLSLAAVLLLLLLLFTCSFAARPDSTFSDQVKNDEEVEKMVSEGAEGGSCNGVGEEECLTRRSLAAHIDYIYTQNNNS